MGRAKKGRHGRTNLRFSPLPRQSEILDALLMSDMTRGGSSVMSLLAIHSAFKILSLYCYVYKATGQRLLCIVN